MSVDLIEYLKDKTYPGRGIAVGSAPNGDGVLLYFIMGRSVNSRNRVFSEIPGGIVTEAADPAKLTDPSLILYAPVRTAGDCTVVTNGDQTDTVCDALRRGGSLIDALRTRTFEPDAPNYTPRISALLRDTDAGFAATVSILKRGVDGGTARFFYEYEPATGFGHLIHTYAADGDPLPSFAGDPVAFAFPADTGAFAARVWDALDPDNKVALYLRRIAPGGQATFQIFNRYEKI